MNTKNILRILVAVFAFATTALAVINIDQLPESWQFYAGIAVAFLLGLKEVVVVVGDYLDDGKRNNSFKP